MLLSEGGEGVLVGWVGGEGELDSVPNFKDFDVFSICMGVGWMGRWCK